MSTKTRYEPMYGLVLLRQLPDDKTTIITPDKYKRKEQRCEVVAVGPGRYNTAGVLLPCMVKVGEKVLVTQWAGVGTEVDLGDEKMLLAKEEVILAKIVEEPEPEPVGLMDALRESLGLPSTVSTEEVLASAGVGAADDPNDEDRE